MLLSVGQSATLTSAFSFLILSQTLVETVRVPWKEKAPYTLKKQKNP